MTLLFAGHDTTTSTVSFMFYELARHPHIVARLLAEQDALLDGGRPTAAQLMSGELPELEMVLEETLRKYPPAWVGPRRSVEPFEFEGHTVPARAFVNYCSWASHHLPDVFPDPEEFRPERFTPEASAALPKGAYVPFGGGSRTCIGMRFGQLEVRTIATLILSRCHARRCPTDFQLSIRQMPTISPKEGLPDGRRAAGARSRRDRVSRPPPDGAAQRRLALHRQPVARAAARRCTLAPTPSHVHVRIGEQRQLQPFDRNPSGCTTSLPSLAAATAFTDAPDAEQRARRPHLHLAAFAAQQLHAEPRAAAPPSRRLRSSTRLRAQRAAALAQAHVASAAAGPAARFRRVTSMLGVAPRFPQQASPPAPG